MLHHWRYFLSLEREFVESLRYVELTTRQEEVFSFEFARLLLLLCSELDVVFKVACDHAAPASGADSIGKYFECLDGKYDLGSEEVRVDRYSRRLAPFLGWTAQAPPSWWTAGNKVKKRTYRFAE